MKNNNKGLISLLIKQPFLKSLIILFFCVFLIPVILICFFYVMHIYDSMKRSEMEKVRTSLQKTESEFNDALMVAKSFSDRLYINKKMQSVLLKEYTNIQDVYSAYSELYFLEEYLKNCREIANFRIYVKNETLLDNSFIVKTSQQTYEEPWFKTAVIMKGHPFWQITYDKTSRKRYLSLVRSVWSPSYRQYVGVLVVNMNTDYIQKNMAEQLYETLIYFDDNFLYSTVNNLNAKEIKELPNFLKNKDYTENIVYTTINNEKVGIFGEEFLPYNSMCIKFKILYMVPLQTLYAQTKSNVIITLFLLGSMIFLSLSVFAIYSHYVKNRVQRIQNGIEKVVANNFEIEKSIGGNDEFESIYRNLYSMSENIKNLIDEVYKQQIEKEHIKAEQNEMSFKMLSSQINPHFLFNTIETIRMKSLAAGDKDVSTMLKLMAQLLRYNLSVKGKPVPLSKEIEAINNYLTIQHMRFGDRISYTINSDFDMSQFEILPLLIQPIVENSFNHGLEDREKGGSIDIQLHLVESNKSQTMIIEVQDNGCGITPEKLVEINNKLNFVSDDSQKNTEASIGIGNVNSRIKLYYKEGSGMDVESIVGQGTKVSIKLIM